MLEPSLFSFFVGIIIPHACESVEFGAGVISAASFLGLLGSEEVELEGLFGFVDDGDDVFFVAGGGSTQGCSASASSSRLGWRSFILLGCGLVMDLGKSST